jgi:uncharacterized protein YcnI
LAGPASAHIHTDPEEVKAGTENTVGFIIEHGCSGSPTTKVELQLPDGVTGISADDANGFTAAVAGQVVTFSGGSLPDATEQAFDVTFTAPAEAGTINIPLIQTCEKGSTDWIEPEVEGQPEPEHPAPQLVIAANPDATTTTTTAAAGSSTTEAPTTTTAPVTTTEAPTTVVVDEDDDSSSTLPIVLGVIALLVVVGGGAALYVRSRNQDGPDSPTDTTDNGPGPDA